MPVLKGGLRVEAIINRSAAPVRVVRRLGGRHVACEFRRCLSSKHFDSPEKPMPTSAQAPENPLHPPTRPFAEEMLDVGQGHRLFIRQMGSEQAIPVLFLHGGPGSGCSPEHARLFDPARCRLILPDQRGSGRSTPAGGLAHNDLAHLIGDLESLRCHLGIEQWLIYGGSWGATLALEYSKSHPGRVLELILRAPFLARQADLDAFFGPQGVARLYPKAYAALCEALSSAHGHDIVARLYAALCAQADLDQAYAAALALDHWEAAVMQVGAAAAQADPAERAARIARKRVYAHYCQQRFFLGENGVLEGLDRIAGIAVTIVHGEHDQVCPIDGSRLLVQEHLPHASLEPVAHAGHGLDRRELQAALRQRIDEALSRHGRSDA
ncbi:MAG: alpha/beta fold hydrolase [Burkholderiaceae bacterium]